MEILAKTFHKTWIRFVTDEKVKITHGPHIPGSKGWGEGSKSERYCLRIWKGELQIAKIQDVEQFFIPELAQMYKMEYQHGEAMWAAVDPTDPTEVVAGTLGWEAGDAYLDSNK